MNKNDDSIEMYCSLKGQQKNKIHRYIECLSTLWSNRLDVHMHSFIDLAFSRCAMGIPNDNKAVNNSL